MSWEKNKTYKFDPKRGKAFSIDTPPPTVSGQMHIGHAASYSQQDFIARFQRMKDNVFYPFGTDDNGLPTERLIEKIKNVKSKDMTRSEFIKLCLNTLKEITPEFIKDWKDLGISSDYEIFYSTIDENSRRMSQKSFIELFKKDIAYKNNFPTIWCPECITSIAQAELEDKDSKSLFTTLKFKVENKDLLIATTRPELLGACVAVFVNPKDKRYKSLVGKKAKVPIFNHEVPIIEDESAEIEKGTGVLMICSYGDKYDVESINRHKLDPKLIINKDGTLNINKYKGLRIKAARKQILEDLKKAKLITDQKEISHIVNTHDKCGTEIEFVTTEQWFIKVLDQKKKLISQGKKIKWSPSYMQKRYENWVNGLEWDWSISRERHFGIPIPVWECKDCNEIILPEEKELPVDPLELKKSCPICNKAATPENKVLDTWATSSLTPQIARSLVSNKIDIPFSLRPQAHDIIRTWAFYTIVKSLYHEDKIPWDSVMTSGFITLKGEKMSKSKGNVIDPKKAIEEYGADAIRFWAASNKLGEDFDYQEKDLLTGKKTITKLWNATNFVFMNLEDFKPGKKPKLEAIDQQFLNKLNDLVEVCTKAFEKFEYSKVKSEIDKFFWNTFAANYLEIVKKRVYQGAGNKRLSAQYTLYNSLLTILKLIAPIMPFITEEIYQTHFKKYEKQKSIHLEKWPVFENAKQSSGLDLLIKIISKVRQVKSVKQKPMNSEILLTIPEEDQNKIKDMLQDLTDVTNAQNIIEGKFKVEII